MKSKPVATKSITDVSFYDRATNEPIEPMTNPKWCIEPIAQITMFKDGKKFAALTKLPTKQVTHTYRRTLRQRLFRKRPRTFTRPEFDFERAVQHIVKVNDLKPSDPEAKLRSSKSQSKATLKKGSIDNE